MGEGLVGRAGELAQVEGIEGHPRETEGKGDGHVGAEVGYEGAPGAPHRAGGQVPLNGHLIRSGGAGPPEQGIDGHAQEADPDIGVEGKEGLRLPISLHYVVVPGGGTGARLEEDEAYGKREAGEEDGELGHVGPDDRPHPTHGGVDDGDGADSHDHPDKGQTGHPGHGEGGGVDDHAHPEQPVEHEQDRREEPRAETIFVLQIFIGAGEALAHEERDQDHSDQGQGEGDMHLPAPDAQTVFDDLAGTGEVADGGQEGGEHAQTHYEPGHAPTRHEVLFGRFLLLAEVVTGDQHHDEIEDDGPEVDGLEAIEAVWSALVEG